MWINVSIVFYFVIGVVVMALIRLVHDLCTDNFGAAWAMIGVVALGVVAMLGIALSTIN